MLFAAGLGTRLGALTRDSPKALVPVAGVPMIEHVARRLIEAGADRLIINVHHFAERVVEFVEARDGFGVEVAFSTEPDHPLETGGGLRRAAPLFRADAPLFLHNADILSDIPLREMYGAHLGSGALATLATMQRETTRRLLFDDRGLCGRVDERKDVRLEVRPPVGQVRERAFAGIHVVSPELLHLLDEDGVFSILDPYLRLSAAGERIDSFDADGYRWLDIGKPEQLEAARAWFDE